MQKSTQACSCDDIANKSDYWYLNEIHTTRWEKIVGNVCCRRCGASWHTSANYIRHVSGSENYRETFANEKSAMRSVVLRKIEAIDMEIKPLQEKKDQLLRKLHKIDQL